MARPYVAEALKRGILINCTHETTLRLLPPFIVTRAEIREFLKRMRTVFAKTKRPEASVSAKASISSSLTNSNAIQPREDRRKGELAAAR